MYLVDALMACHIPEIQHLIVARARQQGTIGTKMHGTNAAPLALQYRDLLVILRSPEPNRVVFASSRQQATVGAEGHDAHCLARPSQGRDMRTLLIIPLTYCRLISS